MLRLTPRRVPVKGVQHSPVTIAMQCHRNHVRQGGTGRPSYQGNLSQESVHAIEWDRAKPSTETKATRIVLRVHEAHDPIQHGILSSADGAHKSVYRLSQIISTGQAPQDPEHLFSGSEPILIFRFVH